MFGKVSVAPCGHTGETIIGNYVRCAVGCDSGSPRIARRGEPGHVVDCACKPCQIRRRATEIVLRTKSGRDFVRVAWNGVQDELKVQVQGSDYVTNYKFLDSDGNIVAQGELRDRMGNPVFVDDFWPLIIRAKLMMDIGTLALSVSADFNNTPVVLTSVNVNWFERDDSFVKQLGTKVFTWRPVDFIGV